MEKDQELKAEDRFRTLFEQSPLSVQLLSVDGRTLQVNQAWRDLWGFPKEFVDNYILKDYNVLKDPQLVEKGIMPVIQAGFKGETGKIPAIFYDTTVLSEQGHKRWVEGFISPILNEEGQVLEVVLIHQDVTEKVQNEQAMNAAREAAEEANRLKSSFLANMSHEIRTPLGAILGFTELLKDSNLQRDEAKEYLEIIDRSGKALTKIIDDILDLSKVEAGRLKVETSSIELKSLLEEVIFLLKIQAIKNQVTIELEAIPETLVRVHSDPIRLRQIMINLLGNAVKFTQKGWVKISVAHDESQFKILVQDSGDGIDPEMHSLLFQPFSQVDGSQTRRFGGSGLGLALSKRLAQALGGDVQLEDSAIGKGSLFSVSLPFSEGTQVKNASSAVGKANTINPVRTLEGLHILIADDSLDNRLLIERFLTKMGATISEADNGQEAIEIIRKQSFDVILMDIQMPVMDGLEAIRTLRAQGHREPIIALTAHAMAEERARSIEAGADAHHVKPLQIAELTQTIVRLTAKDVGSR